MKEYNALSPSNVDASARGMIKNFGSEAASIAKETMQKCERKDETDGRDVWFAIGARIVALQSRLQIINDSHTGTLERSNAPPRQLAGME